MHPMKSTPSLIVFSFGFWFVLSTVGFASPLIKHRLADSRPLQGGTTLPAADSLPEPLPNTRDEPAAGSAQATNDRSVDRAGP